MLHKYSDEELKTMVKPPSGNDGDTVDELPIYPMPISITPYQHQIRGFNRCMENDGYGLLFQVGLGKSATAIAAAGARFLRGEVKRLLIICPLAVQSVWERECKNLTAEYSARLLEGGMAKRRDALRLFPKDGLQIAVINYEGACVMTDNLLKW
ncbi:MAG: DEAD/DEAH box helicase family protein [Clostridiales bacterium]|jgi:SNF2 family DNA or RNA helicase|nr:DEAD/DEAH box helicase family protein [Clostridiales bacterium]